MLLTFVLSSMLSGISYQTINITADVTAEGEVYDSIEWWKLVRTTDSESMAATTPGSHSLVTTARPDDAYYSGAATIDFHADLGANSISLTGTMDSYAYPYHFLNASFNVRSFIRFTVDEAAEYDVTMLNTGQSGTETIDYRRSNFWPFTENYAPWPGGGFTYNVPFNGRVLLEPGTLYSFTMNNRTPQQDGHGAGDSAYGTMSLQLTPVAVAVPEMEIRNLIMVAVAIGFGWWGWRKGRAEKAAIEAKKLAAATEK